MTNATKPAEATLFQVSVALAFFLALCMARNLVNHEPEVDLVKPTKLTLPEIQGMPPSTEPTNPEPNTSGCSNTYAVKKGETCYSTWTRFKVKEETFYALNPGIACDNLDIGQALCIAGGDAGASGDLPKPSKPASPEWPALSPSTGQVDPEPSTSGCSNTYAVKKGETCYSTWTRFKVKEETFYALNPGIDCDNLDIGQALCIAGGAN